MKSGERWALGLLLAMLWVALPFVPDEHVHMGWAHMALVAAIAALAGLVAWRRSRVAFGPSWWVVLLAGASLLVATLVEPGRFPHAERWWTAHTGWAHGLFFLSALVLVPGRGERGDVTEHRFDPEVAPARSLRFVLVVLLVALVVAQAVAMVPQFQADERPSGSFGNPNILGATLAASALALAAFARWRPVAWVPTAAVLALILGTGSRGALAATSAVLLLLAFRRSLRTVVVVAALILLVLVLVPNPLTERVLALRSDHQYSRLFFWEVALRNIAEHPLGIGPGMNRVVFPPLALDQGHPWLLHQRHAVGLTHNVLLTLTLEWGWAAGAAVATWLVWVGRRLSREGRPEALGRGAALGAAVLLLEAQVDGLEQNPLAFSLLLFLLAVALRRVPGREPGPALPGRVVGAVLLAAALVLARQTWERRARLVAGADARQAVVAVQESAPGSDAERAALQLADAAVTRAEQVAPDEATAHLQRFLLLEERVKRVLDASPDQPEALAGLLLPAWQALDRARSADPSDPWLTRSAARFAIRLYRRAGRQEALLETYFGAMSALLALDPLNVSARWELAQEALRVGRVDQMEAQCRRLFELEPDDALAWHVLAVMREFRGDDEAAAYAYQRAVEAIFNARLKQAIDSPASRDYYQRILERAPLPAVRRAQAALRRRLYG